MATTSSKHPVLTVLGLSIDEAFESRDAVMRLLEETRLLAGFPKTLELFTARYPAARTHPLLTLGLPLEQSLRTLRERGREGPVLLLCNGDPLFFGLGAKLRNVFQPDDLRIIPSPSSVQLACARLSIQNHDIRPLSLHGRDDLSRLDEALAQNEKIALLLDERHSPSFVAGYLREHGAHHYAMHVFTDLGSENEHYEHHMPDSPMPHPGGPALALLLPTRERRPVFGLPNDFFSPDYATALPVRGSAVALLSLSPTHVLWDIGAGSGAFSFDAAVLLSRGRVYAVEERKERAERIRKRAQLLQAATVHTVHGRAPECLETLPDPDAIFLGGGLMEEGETLLRALTARLRPGGILVAAIVLLESLGKALNFCRTEGVQWDLHEIQISSSRPLAGDRHMKASNPVFLLRIQKHSLPAHSGK
ncbi:MAG: precorrin-6y C5,15-methyltransferase (decarboxylating) subunit CbiE [Desulfovibrio sp.]|nr:precorrin-6y C5,15-methyltransferase (decarboxylating) subunit CbiE [Desulfovibrio sp.]